MDPCEWFLYPYGDPNNLNRMYCRDTFVIDFVRVESLGTKDSRHIYGRIFVVDMERQQNIFERDRSNPEKVEVGGHLPLSIPERFIWGEGECYIYVQLFDAEDDHQIADGMVDWLLSGTFPLNKTLRYEIIGECGCSFLVQYFVPSASMRADIKIKFPITNPLRLRDHEKGEKLEIYGSVKVELNFGFAPDRDSKTITMFERVESDAVVVGAEEAIPFLVPYVIAQVPKELPSLNILIDLRGRGISRDGSETAPFMPIQKKIPFNIDGEASYSFPIVFHNLLRYYDLKQKTMSKRHQKSHQKSNSNNRFLKLPSDLQVAVILH